MQQNSMYTECVFYLLRHRNISRNMYHTKKMSTIRNFYFLQAKATPQKFISWGCGVKIFFFKLKSFYCKHFFCTVRFWWDISAPQYKKLTLYIIKFFCYDNYVTIWSFSIEEKEKSIVMATSFFSNKIK